MSGSEGYAEVMARRDEIVRRSVGIDYAAYTTGALAFDYERLLADPGYDVEDVRELQRRTAVGDTPLVELPNLTRLARSRAAPGRGARIFVKDEAANPSGSFKDRRASLSAHEAKERGFEGLSAATSGNYGAAVASQAAKLGLRCIVVQEAFDSARRRPARDRREDPGLRGLWRRGDPPVGGPGTVLPVFLRVLEEIRLLQRLALHAATRSRVSRRWALSWRSRRWPPTGRLPRSWSSPPTRGAAT